MLLLKNVKLLLREQLRYLKSYTLLVDIDF
jgi:hypothetical protein